MRKKTLLFTACVLGVGGLSLCLTGCKDSKKLKTPENLSYDGTAFRWDSVSGATSYAITINGEQLTATTNEYSYKAEGLTYNVELQAIDKNGEKESSEIVTQSFKPLDTIKDLNFNKVDYEIEWSNIANATGYTVEIDGRASEVVNNEKDYNVTGDHVVKVKPINKTDKTYYSVWSEPINFTILETPKNVRYDFENSLICWDKVKKAKGYKLVLDDKEIDLDANTTSYFFNEDVKTFKVSVYAVGDDKEIVNSLPSKPIVFHFLDEVKNITVDSGALTWDKVDEAVKYRLQIKTNNLPTITKFVEDNTFAGLKPGNTYSIVVTAYGKDDTYCPSVSSEFKCNILSTPSLSFASNTNVNSTSANIISWTSTNNEGLRANGYLLNITLDGEPIFEQTFGPEVLSTTDFQFVDAGTYEVRVKALADPESTVDFDSSFSEPWTIKRLGRVKNVHVIGNNTTTPKLIFDKLEDAKSYNIKMDGTEIEANNTNRSVQINIENQNGVEKTVNYKVTANGSINTYSRKAILGTTDEEATELAVTKLATPNKPIIENKKISFDAVSEAGSYNYYLDGNATEINSTFFDLPGITSGEHEFTIQALSSSETSICSDISEELVVTKLGAPKNLLMKDKTLTWDKEYGATAYTVKVGTKEINVENRNSTVIDDQYVDVTGVSIYVYARGNKKDIIDSEVSGKVQVFRLATVQGLEVDKDNIVWNEVKGAKGYRVLINNNNPYYDNDIPGTSVDNSIFKVGSSTVSVIARGDNAYYYDSEPSQVLTVEKLAAPEVRVEDNKYKWDFIMGAQNYEVMIGDNKYIVQECEFDPKEYFKIARVYTVKIRALGGDATSGQKRNLSSDYTEIKQTVTALTTPINFTHTYDSETNKATITVDPYKDETIIKGYEFFVGGVSKGVEDTNTFTYDISEAGTYTAVVRYIGGAFDAEGNIYYITSNKSVEKNIKILKEVNDIQINVGPDGQVYVTWANPNLTASSIVNVKVNGVALEGYTEKKIVGTKIGLSGIKSGDEVEISIRVVADSSGFFDSKTVTLSKTIN